MWKTIIRRILILIPQLFVLSLLMFFIASLMPGDPMRAFITPEMTMEQVEAIRDRLGLNDPWHVQYLRWMRGILFEWDFGTSILHRRPVTEVIADRIGNTMRLSFLTAIFTYAIAIPLGIIAARKKDTIIDRSIMVYTFVALSMPSIVFGLINILAFAFGFGWFPAMGTITTAASMAGGMTAVVSQLYHSFLPAITLALLSTVSIIYFLRSEIIDYDSSDFVTTARSKGVPESKVYTGHILRNAMLPIAGSIGSLLASLFMGTIFIEHVFTYSGMGELTLTSIRMQDWPVANTLIMFYAILTVASILLTDIIITVIDPRIRIK
ncbi:MAG: ABC transporter permease [Defluviitaleaceae bacterium]|nr:ABC transporter permease [Defluviitaleaceae bacterium]